MSRKSNNELATDSLVSDIKDMTNLREEIVRTVINAIEVRLLEDVYEESQYRGEDYKMEEDIRLDIPKIGQVVLSPLNRGPRTFTSSIILDKRFFNKLKNSYYQEHSYLHESIVKNFPGAMSKKINELSLIDDNEGES